VNHYPHHIGDFDRATRHLTRIERSIYRDLLDVYYDTETQLTLDLPVLRRKILARSNEESTAVEQVLNEFFTKTPTGWYHDRCEEELEAYRNSTSQKAAAGRASAAAKAAKRERAINSASTPVQQPFKSVATEFNGTSTNQEPRTKNQLVEPTVLIDDKSPTVVEPPTIDRVACPMQAIADAWNATAVSMAAVKPVAEWAEPRKRVVKARWVEKLKLGKYVDRQSGIDYWTRVFARVESSDFLAGRVGGTFAAHLDWVMNSTNLAKIIENGYPNRQAVTA
jgi:uncharacterized protein YdaU (DUF1376 family)